MPGLPPPAHLSPFVDGQKEGYMPQREKEIIHLKGQEVVESEDDDEELLPDEADKGPAKGAQKTTAKDADASGA